MPKSAPKFPSDQEVAVFYTGGTIGMQAPPPGEPGHGAVPNQAFTPLMASLARRLSGVRIRPVAWADVPSPHMTPERMFELSRDVDRWLALPEVAGAVVVHGTDVMEESAYLLHLTVASDKPVVFTGAMRTMDELGYDGLRNLHFAVLACGQCPPGAGTLLLMSDRLFAAPEAVKIHSLAIDSFDAPGLGPIGSVAGEVLHLSRWPRRRQAYRPESLETHVDLVRICPGMDGRFLDCSREMGAAGVVVEGFGAGNVPPSVLDALERLLAANVPVVLASRCIQGGVWPVYGYPGGAAGLRDRGVILAGGLPGHKARLKLMVGLGLSYGPAQLKEMFEGSGESRVVYHP